MQLSLNGKGIINRKIQYQKNEPIDDIIHQIMPGADTRQLYYTLSVEKDKNKAEINIIRKDIIDNLLEEFKKLNTFVTHIFLGTSALETTASLIDSDLIISSHYIIDVNNGGKLEQKTAETPSEHTLADETLDGNMILPFGAALEWFLKKQSPISNIQEVTANIKEEYFSYKNLKFSLITGLSAIFIILLINFISFGSLTKKSNHLNSYLSKHKKDMERVTALKHEVAIKEKYLFDNKLLSGTKISYYSDRIGMLVPDGIRLTELNIHPSLEENKNFKQLTSFQNNKIIIRGNDSNNSLQDFIRKLEKEQWIADVDLDNYTADKQNKSVLFSLIVFIR